MSGRIIQWVNGKPYDCTNGEEYVIAKEDDPTKVIFIAADIVAELPRPPQAEIDAEVHLAAQARGEG